MSEGAGIYWLIGCLIVGLAVSHGQRECPDDHSKDPLQLAAEVAIWPVYAVVTIANRDMPTPPRSCAAAGAQK